MQILVVMVISWILTWALPPALTASGIPLGGFQGTLAILKLPGVWFFMIYQGVLATGLAFFLMCICQAHLGSTEAAIIYCLEAVFTALLAASGFVPGVKEILSPTQILGGALILAAMLLMELGARFIRSDRTAGDAAIG